MRFLAEANLTQIIAREERHVEPGEARPELDDRIRQIFGGAMFELALNPGVPTDIPDDLGEGKPRLALMSYDAFGVGSNLVAVPELIAKLYERKGAEGSGLRSLRNNLVFLLADESRIADMKRAIARRIALRTLKAPDRLNELAEHQRQQVIVQEAKSEHAVALEIQQCYRHILYPNRIGIGTGLWRSPTPSSTFRTRPRSPAPAKSKSCGSSSPRTSYEKPPTSPTAPPTSGTVRRSRRGR